MLRTGSPVKIVHKCEQPKKGGVQSLYDFDVMSALNLQLQLGFISAFAANSVSLT